MIHTKQPDEQKSNTRAQGDWKACLVTSQNSLARRLNECIGNDRLRVKRRVVDLVGETDCNLYIVDTKVPDIAIWPAPILINAGARSKPWFFLVSKPSDMSSLTPLPERTTILERDGAAIDWLVLSANRLFGPEPGRKIARASYIEDRRLFVVRMESGKVYLLKVDDLPEADASRVIRYAVARNHNYFAVRQESGNRLEVPWDDVLYHCEPGYEYYKGKQAGDVDRDRARRIGEKIRQLRERKGLTVQELANKAGLKRPNVSRLEHGRHVPSLETLERLAEVLGVPVADIVAT